ncbi:Transcriptional regulator, AraC family [hydrothermal vent metagenome]|uniref:Transcriptional regulator, AraC family n=1 Tax=hydrothermal vent metagenome TaxID=652676 RepID=A0A3B0YW28_9ZZZZ
MHENRRHVEQINKALPYIEACIGEGKSLTLENVSQFCNVSSFHFHRVFQSCVGQTFGKYVRRLRLERAAFWLLYTAATVSEVSESSHYESNAVFSRAFKKHFQESPSNFRRNRLNISTDSFQQFFSNLSMQDIEPVDFCWVKSQRLAFIRKVGRYESVASLAWHSLKTQTQFVPGISASELYIGIAHDNPLITDYDQMRYDACVPVSMDFKPSFNIGICNLPSAHYAKFLYKGKEDEIWSMYDAIYYGWLLKNKISLINFAIFSEHRPCSEKNEIALYVPICK